MNIASQFLAYKKEGRLSYRLLLYVVLCSALFTLMTTCFQLYVEYSRDRAIVYHNIEFIQNSYVKSVATSAFSMDERKVQFLLEGILKLQDIVYLEVVESDGNEKEIWIAQGDLKASQDIVREFPLLSEDFGKAYEFGVLRVAASLKGVYQRLWEKVLIILITNTVKTFLASFCILLIIQFTVTRHLTSMAAYTRQLDLNKLDQHLALNRRSSEFTDQDELDQVVTAINDMQVRMKQDITRCWQAEEALRKARDDLEVTVRRRTKELVETNTQLKQEIEVRKRTETELRVSEEKFRRQFKGMPVPTLIWQKQGDDYILTDYNEAAETFSRGNIRNFLRMNAYRFYRQDFPEIFQDMDICFKEKKTVQRECYYNLRTTGERKFIVIFHVFIPPDMVINHTIDLTEHKQMQGDLKKAKEAAESANQAKSEFLTNMSHELRTPLNGILGYTQILRRNDTLTEQQGKALMVIHRSGEHLLMLINDILDISRIEARKMILEPADFHFPGFLKTVADITRIRADQKNIFFEYKTASNLPQAMHGDEKRLRQILLNLIGNAVKFTEQGKVVFTVTRHTTAKIRFQVEDTGIGIPAEKLEDMFLPFHQMNDRRIKAEGTGLGLAISRKLVRKMGGELYVKSIPDQGSIFWFDIDLPEIAWKTATVKKKKKIIAYAGEKRKLLIVDDILKNRLVLRDMLFPLGFEIIEAADGQEAINKAATFHPDLIFMDLVMPEMDGFETTMQIREMPQVRDTVVIALSAKVSAATREASLTAGCDSYAIKPVDMDSILELLKSFLKLEWIYQEDEGNKGELVSESECGPMIPPPKEEIDKLLKLAKTGDASAIRDRAKVIEASGPEYIPFGKKLYQLARELQIIKIKKFLSQYADSD